MLDKNAIKDIMYASLLELSKNKQNFYHSGISDSYSKFTDNGQTIVIDYLEKLIPIMHRVDQAELDKRAKQMVIDGLKGKEIKKET